MSEETPEPQAKGTDSPPDPTAPPADEPAGEDEDLEPDDETLRQSATTIINIMRLQAQNAPIGVTADSRSRSTGTIKAHEIRITLTAFRASDAFRRAQKVLADEHLVVLVGNQASGRYTAAIGLLADWPALTPDTIVNSLSPTTSVGDLAETGIIKRGRRYLVHDIRGDGHASAEQRHNLSRLRPTLIETRSRLVITAEPGTLSPSDFGDLVVEWKPPGGAEIFDEHLATGGLSLASADLDRAQEYAAGLSRPAEIAAFVTRIRDGGLEAAMSLQSEVDRRHVADWLDDQSLALADKLTLAAACFLNGVPEHVFERCLARLDQLFREHGGRITDPATSQPDNVDKPWTRLDGLLRTVASAERFGERQVEFCSPYMRAHALAEVWNRYSHRLIEPVRTWIHELAGDISVDVRIQTAFGVARLAERWWQDVEESFLVPWANGTQLHRLAAVNLLSAMTASDELAPRALQLALAWSENQGPRRAMTAALALGGPLSSRYPQATFNQLWYLTSRASRIAAAARVGLSLMLTGAAEVPHHALRTLRYTVDALDWALDNLPALERRDSVSAVGVILTAPRLRSDELVIAELLRTDPESVEPIGILIAEVLASGPHHHGGVDLLRKLLIQFAEEAEHVALAGRLGRIVLDRWTPGQRAVLGPQLKRALEMSEEEAELARDVISSFIRSIDRSEG
jgi:hypothetical protein